MSNRLILVSHALCPYVQRAAIALHEKGVAYETAMIDLSRKPDWFVAISPLGKTPLLRVARDDGTEAVLFESNVICEYVEDTVPEPPLHPNDPLDRAHHRAWMEFGSAVLADIWGLETTQDAAVFRAKQHAIAAKLARIETALGSGPYFAGERFSLVDAVFGPVFRYFEVFDRIHDTGVFTSVPKVRAWRGALAARPSVSAVVVPDYADRLMDFLRRHDAHLLSLAA